MDENNRAGPAPEDFVDPGEDGNDSMDSDYSGNTGHSDKQNGDIDGQDEFDHIGAAIALRLKAMTPEDARQTYVKIFKLVSEEEERLKVLAAKNKK